MKIGSFKLGSTAEVKNHFVDLIYFSGCSRNCCYCFNPELINSNSVNHMNIADVLGQLPGFTDVVVLTGGEPLDQDISGLITALRYKRKRIILETAMYNQFAFGMVEKVLFCIKTFDLDEQAIKSADRHDNVDFVIVIGHEDFNMDGFKRAHELVKNNKIYHRYNAFRNARPVEYPELFEHVRKEKQFLVFNKICL